MLSARSKRKVLEWVKRYMPAQILGTLVALVAAYVTYQTTHSLVVSAYASTIAEAAAYYGAASVRDVIAFYRHYHPHRTFKRLGLTAARTSRALVMEFGVAGTLDGVAIRPYLMWILPQAFGNVQLGWLVAKIAADIIFYGFAIMGYELHKRRYSLNQTPAMVLAPVPAQVSGANLEPRRRWRNIDAISARS